MNLLRLIFGGVVLTAWGVSFTVALFDRTYHPDPSLQILAAMVAGFLFAPSIIRKVKNGNGGNS